MRRDRLIAVVFAGLMVLSMPAAGIVGASNGGAHDATSQMQIDGAEETTTADATPTAEPNASTYVDPALADLDGTEQLLLQLEQPAVRSSGTEELTAESLRAQADRTQGPVLETIDRMDAVTATSTHWISNVIVVDAAVDDATVDRLADIEAVDAVHLSRDVEPPEPVSAEPADPAETDANTTYGLEQINVPAVWEDFGVRGEGSRVAVIDTGLDPAHPALDLYTEDPDDPTYPGGYEAFDDSGDPIDGLEPISGPPEDPGHGDHTSGTATGSAANGTHIGVAPEADLIHGDVFREGGTDATVIGAIEWAVEQDADVVSMSLGFGCADPFQPEPEYVDSLLDPIDNARAAGTAMVVSTGNAGEGCVGAPGSQYDTYGIGATNEGGDVTFFSSGDEIHADGWDDPNEEWPDSWIKPDVVAPGNDVLSAGPDGEGYVELSGTSMSAPHVTGVVALLRSFNPDVEVEEIEDALNEHAEKPDDWIEPGDERDTRYGLGIVDARASIEEIDADVELGDVSANGEISADDVAQIETVAVGNEPDGVFIPVRADLDRDGTVGLSDMILAQQRSAGVLDSATLEVTDLEMPDEVDGDETATVTATIENDDPLGTLEYAELRLGEDRDALDDEGATLDQEFVDVAAPGVETPSDRPAESTVTFEVDATDLVGDDYAVGVFTDDHDSWDELTVREPFFEVTDIDAPAEIDQGETLSVDVEITNTANDHGEMDVEYRLVNDIGETDVVDEAENVSLEAGESTVVTFEIDTAEVDGGTYTQEISSPDDTSTADVHINEPYLAVTDVDGPAQLFAEDSYAVDATIENLGDAPDEQIVDYELTDLDVAVVDVADGDEQGAEIVDVLSDGTRYDATLVHAEDLEDAMNEYDAFVVQRLGSDEIAETFLDDLENQGVVYLDSFQGQAPPDNWADGVYRLHNVLENPETRGEVSTDSDGEAAELEIDADHPLFDGVGDEGDVVEMFNDTSTGSTWGAWFADYDGDELATIDFGNGYGGSSVAVNDEGDEVLLTASARSSQTEPDSFTEESDRLLTNAVDYVLTGDVTPASASTETTVDLEPGESETVTFDHTVPADHETGDSLHTVATADAIGAADVTVLEDDFFEITAVDAPTEADQTETIEVTATVENTGLEAGVQDVEYVFDGEVVDVVEDVALDVGESVTVTLEYTIDDYETPGPVETEVRTAMDDHEVPLEVLEIDDAHFAVDVTDAPETVDQLDEIDVTATVENTGDREATGTIAYEFMPYISVAVVDDDPTTHGVDELASDLDAEFGEEAVVETVAADDLLAEMDEYDVLVVNNFGGTDTGDFLDALEDDQGVVYIDQAYGSGSNAIYSLAEERDSLDDLEEDFAGSPTFYEVEAEHPVFDGLATEGERLNVTDTGNLLSFDSYGGDVAAGIGAGVYTVLDPGVGVDDDANEVLLAGHGLNGNNPYGEYEEDALPILVNAVDHLGGQTVDDGGESPVDSTTENVTLEGGESTTVEFTTTIPLTADSGDYLHIVESDDDAATQDFEVDEEVTAVRGTVTDAETGDPIAGATVSIAGDVEYETETDADGEYFVEVEPGNYVVDADADGYETDAIVTLEDGDVKTVDHELSAIAGDITGTVTDEAGTPIEGATVADADGDAFEVETNADGEYVIEDQPGGIYALEADADGYETSDIEFVEHSADQPGEQDFALAEAEPEATFEIGIDAVDETVTEGDELTLEYTVENTGDAADVQDVAFAVDDTTVDTDPGIELEPGQDESGAFTYATDGDDVPAVDVSVSTDDDSETETVTVDAASDETAIAVVDDDPTTHGVDDAASELGDRLAEDAVVETLPAADLLDEAAAYDAFVVNHFGGTDVGAFLDALEDDQGVVYLDSYGDGEDGSNAVRALANERDDPVSVTDDSGAGAGELYYEVTETHPIFDGLAESGDEIEIAGGIYQFPYFEEYSGDGVADVGYGITASGPGVGADDGSNEVLLAANGFSADVGHGDYTTDGNALLANAVAHVSDATVQEPQLEEIDVELEDTEILDEDESTYGDDDETTATVTAVFDIGEDEDVTDAATLTSTDETVATVADDGLVEGQEAGTTEIEAEYEGETASAALEVIEQATFEVGIDGTNAPIEEGDTLEVTATVENTGDDSGEQDVDLFDFDGNVVDTVEDVALDGGESEQVTLTWETGADAGEDDVTVETEDDTDATTVEITELEGDANVAVVDDDPTTHGVDEAVVELNQHLEDDFAETLPAADLLAEMDAYDVIVVNHFGGTDVGDFLAALEDDQGVVYLDTADGGANAIEELATERGDPGTVETEYDTASDIGYHVTDETHPVFDGIETDDGDVVIHEDAGMVYFEDYGGDVVAEIGAGVSLDDGPGVGIDDEANEVLLGGHGLADYSEYEAFTDDGITILGNAVEHALGAGTSGETASVGSITPAPMFESSPLHAVAGE